MEETDELYWGIGTHYNPPNLFRTDGNFGDKYNFTIDPADGISAPADSNLDFMPPPAYASAGNTQESSPCLSGGSCSSSNDETIPSDLIINRQGYVGPTSANEKTATSSTMVLQTQPVIRAEQGLEPPEAPCALPGTSGSQDLNMTTKGPTYKCNIDRCGKTLASKFSLR